MPTVISDASVLIALGAAGLSGLLREFYSDVLVPPAVWDEVTQAGARPGAAEGRAARSDGWLQVRHPRLEALVARLKADLDNGEAEAIALAVELPQSLLLVDEAEGRQAALQLGLDFTGTLGLLLRAKRAARLVTPPWALVCLNGQWYLPPMSTVQEIKAAIDALSPEERAELDRLLRESPAALDAEVDSPELEAELLKAIDGPYTPYSAEEMRAIGERILREKSAK
jgi:predicted nucleic acid-binding protein